MAGTAVAWVVVVVVTGSRDADIRCSVESNGNGGDGGEECTTVFTSY